MGNFNLPGLGVAYRGMLILFRMHTHYLSLLPRSALHTWKNSRPKGIKEFSQFM